MHNLSPPDSHYLNAAQGWMELGDHLEAIKELDRISAEFAEDPSVLELRWQAHARAGEWKVCLEVAARLKSAAPERHSGWLNHAESLHQLGRTAEALEGLVIARGQLRQHWSVACSMACYSACLGKLAAAQAFLAVAYRLARGKADKAQIRRLVLKDPKVELVLGKLLKIPK